MEIKKFKAGDEKAILDLFKLAFNKEMSMEYWKWRFQDNPFSDEFMIHLMWEGDLLVGHYAVSPVEMVVNGDVEKTALSMTTMTHPEYNGRGIFTQLSSSLYNELKDEHEYAMVWGFPNNNSHYAFIKNLKWKNLATIPMLSLKALNLKKIETEVTFKKHSNFTESFSQKLSSVNKAVKINRTAKYLNWRYVANPSADYKIISINDESAIIVYKIIPSFLKSEQFEIDIMEIQFNQNPVQLQELLSSILELEEVEIEKFNLWASIFSDDYLHFKKLGFVYQMPITYLGCLNLASEDKNLSQYQEWDINFGYSDVF
jgi:GNAT superfamily N-acetyltransferase